MSLVRSFIKDASIVMVATTIANVCNLGFQLYMVRNLEVHDFGVLTALLTGFFIFSVPCFAIQTVMTKWTAQFKAKGEDAKIGIFFWELGRWMFVFSIGFATLGIWGADTLAGFLNMEKSEAVTIGVISVSLATLFPLWLGLLQGVQWFWTMGALWVAASVIKLILGILFVEWGMNVEGALLGVLLSFALVLPFTFWVARIWTRPVFGSGWKWSLHETQDAFQYLFPVAIMFVCFTLLTQSDIILVKHFFPPLSAGIYAAASMVGKIVLFLPLAISWVLLPKSSSHHAQDQDSTLILKMSLWVTAVLCTGITLVSFVWPQGYILLFKVSYKEQFVLLARLFSVAMSFYALTQIIMTYQLSVRNLSFLVPTFILTLIQVGLIWFFHNSLSQVLWFLCAFGALILSVNLLQVRWGPSSRSLA